MPSLKFLCFLWSTAFVKGSLYRLPNDVVPISYELRIAPNPTNNTFAGEVNIEVHVKFTTDRIILNSVDLEIGNVRLKKLEASTSETAAKFELDKDKQILIIKNAGNFEYNTDYNVWIRFQGSLFDYDMRDNITVGFYKQPARYYNQSWAVFTHFEAIEARTVFPCFDEPRYRAPFNISVARPENYTAVSNMPSEAVLPPDSLSNGFVWEKFQPTPPMPTYLVAFVVAELKSLTSADGRVRLMTRPDRISRGEYALKQAEKLLKYFEGYTGIPYSLPKLDVVEVPLFDGAAMENWGLFIFGEKYILLEKRDSDADQKTVITSLVSHELAHLWFGDILTMSWYDYLWIKEGFGAYFEYFGTAAIEPSWDMESYFVVELLHETLLADIKIGVPMTRPIRDSDHLDSTFNEISYGKAACVIRMFELMLFPKTFQNALHNYLKKGQQYQHGVTTPRNLFDAFDHQVELDCISYLPPHVSASDIMKTWTDNVGYPVINVIRSYDRKEVEITQTPFKPMSPLTRVKNDQKWIVPLTYTTKSELQFSDVLPTHWSFADEPTVISNVEEGDWVLFNLKQSGYYRVNYDERNWKLLINQLTSNHTAIHPLNRAQLIDDATILFLEDKLSFSILLSLLEYLKDETDIKPLYTASNAVFKLLSAFEGRDDLAFFIKHETEKNLTSTFKKYFKKLFKKPYESLECNENASSSNDHVKQLLKPKIIQIMLILKLNCIEI